jgi:AcrR family transcriptional regulator
VPRAGLTRQRVVADAAVLVDELGWGRLSLAAVATRLGVKLPSLYKHIDSLDGLRGELAVLGTRELGAAITSAAMGRAGGDALRAVADAYRGYAIAHPGRYAATVRAPQPDDLAHVAATDAVLRVVLAVLAGYGLSGDDAIDAARALRAALHGFITLEASGGFGLPRDVDRSYQRLVAGLDSTFASWAETTAEPSAEPQLTPDRA